MPENSQNTRSLPSGYLQAQRSGDKVQRDRAMVRFTVCDDEDDLPISRRRFNKRQRTTTPSQLPLPPPPPPLPPRPQPQQQSPNNNEQDEGDEELISVEEVSSDYQTEEDEEVKEEEEDEEEEEEEEVDVVTHNEDQTRTSASAQALNGFRQSWLQSCHSRDTMLPNADGSIPVTLTDPDVLDCPICLETLTVPVFQCENGHIACSSCCNKIKYRCPSCCWPIGYNRCRAIEKVIESVKISCRNMNYGCKDPVIYSKKHEHEQTCLHAPCWCPRPRCNFVGSSKNLYLHFSSVHNNAMDFIYGSPFFIYLDKNLKWVIFREKNDGVIFILNHAGEGLGNVISVNCIGPTTSKKGFSYQLTAKNGETSLGLQSFVESMPKWVEHPPRKAFLMVPRDFISSSGQIPLKICIRKFA